MRDLHVLVTAGCRIVLSRNIKEQVLQYILKDLIDLLERTRSEAHLKNFFAVAGEIKQVSIPADFKTGASKGPVVSLR
ncbi:unnamed protein product [Urochloa humidicola]